MQIPFLINCPFTHFYGLSFLFYSVSYTVTIIYFNAQIVSGLGSGSPSLGFGVLLTRAPQPVSAPCFLPQNVPRSPGTFPG